MADKNPKNNEMGWYWFNSDKIRMVGTRRQY